MHQQTLPGLRRRRRSGVPRNPNGDKTIPADFTEREQDVVAVVRKGMTNKEIAAEMYISEKAVEDHLRNVYGKLRISSRRELRSRS
jgi:DNA-binding NarL/FixJ family response regulator